MTAALNKISTNQSRANMPCLLVVFMGMMLVSPLGAGLILKGELACPAAFLPFISFISSLNLERYLYRVAMTISYVIQNRSKIVSSFPMVFKMVAEAVERMMPVLGMPTVAVNLILRQAAIARVTLRSSVNDMVISVVRGIQTRYNHFEDWLKSQLVDDFFWHSGWAVPALK